MATKDSKIILKRSTIKGKIPNDVTLGEENKLIPGEVAINLADEILYIKGLNGELLIFNPGVNGIPPFDETAEYLAGDIIYRTGSFYSANVDKLETDMWIPANWTRLTATAEEGIPVYSPSKTYAEGDLVKYLGKIFTNKIAITTPEPWTYSRWEDVGAISISAFTATSSYGSSALVTYGGGIYKAKSAINPGSWNETDWSPFVLSTSITGSSIISTGTTAQRDTSPAVGYTRYNTDILSLETWTGTAWSSFTPKTYVDENFVKRTSPTGSMNIPAGTTAERDPAPNLGAIRWNTDLVSIEGWDGTNWVLPKARYA